MTVVRIVSAFLPLIVHIDKPADPSIFCGPYIVADLLKLIRITDVLPGLFQEIDRVVGISGVAKPHRARPALFVLLSEGRAHLVCVYA